MKKSYLMISAAAIIFAACSSNDSFKEVDTQDTPIAFTSYTQHITKAPTENNDKNYAWYLEDHHKTFLVFGYRTVGVDDTTHVFNNQTVDYDGTTDDAWDYSPHRFWERRATSYTFYAAAPDVTENSAHKWVLNKNASVEQNYNSSYNDNYYFTYTGYTLADHDATTADATASANNYVQSFSNFGLTPETGANANKAIDLMIAAPCNWTQIGTAVNLEFIHVLSRLNVIVQRGDQLTSNDVVKIQAFEVCGFYSGGNFRENITNAVNANGYTASRWEGVTSTSKVNYTTTTALMDEIHDPAVELTVKYDVADTAKHDGHAIPQYILQSLVVPQDITYEALDINGKDSVNHSTDAQQAYLHIKYTIHNDKWTGNKTEQFEGYYNLAKAFGAVDTDDQSTAGVDETKVTFYEGWQNNLTLIINPNVIYFVPKVSEWGDRNFEYEVK